MEHSMACSEKLEIVVLEMGMLEEPGLYMREIPVDIRGFSKAIVKRGTRGKEC